MAEPGWYADPTAPQGRRYWDGQRWMETGSPTRRGPGAALWLLIALVVIGGVIAAIIMFPSG
ncbi:MAG TPA: DUF2510 domain-containing protein, partial [Propionicimonas sp.]|nr:DUF2510 domain-containing protein [Propionicimonas sp.]